VYHSWLAQFILYGLTTVSAPDRLVYVVFVFTFLLVMTPLVLVALVWRRFGSLSAWSVVPFLLALRAIAPRMEPRPELFTAVCLAVLLYFLVCWSAARAAPARQALCVRDLAALVCILALFTLWANLHGGVVLGLVVLGVTACAEVIQDRCSRRSLALVVLVPLAFLAVCVNPYGIGYLQTFGRVQSFTFAHIIEWRAIWRTPSVVPEVLPTIGVVTALATLAWVLNPERRWAQLGWLVVLGTLFVWARRNVWPFTLAALMVLAANSRSFTVEGLTRAWSRLVPDAANSKAPPAIARWYGLLQAGLLIWLALEAATLALNPRLWNRPRPISLEHGVVAFLRDHAGTGRVFNDYENSGYLQWSLAGRPPLFLDRMDSYPDRVMRDYQAMVQMTEDAPRLLDELGIDVVVLTTNRGGQSLAALARHLDAHQEWARVFADRAGVIWIRRLPAYDHLVRQHSKVNTVAFATLERYGDDDEMLTPPVEQADR
jgi:hypothetical protein